MFFHTLTRAEALEYREYVRGSHRAKLSELASLMSRTDGPLEAMDASLGSLEPLWRWAKVFADDDFPGLADDARPRYFTIHSRPIEPRLDRMGVVGELIEHYVFEVLHFAHSEARIDLLLDPKVTHHQETGIVLPDGMPVSTTDFYTRMIARYLYSSDPPSEERSPDDELLSQVRNRTRRRDRDGAGRSILAPLLDPDAELTDEFDWIFLNADGSTDAPVDSHETPDPPLEFPRMTPPQARSFLHSVEARHLPALRELAEIMRETDGPIEQMDAGLDSLIPLWRWVIQTASEDFHGVPEGVTKSSYVALGIETSEHYRRIGYVAELVEHYVFEVLHYLDSGMTVSLNDDRRHNYLETGPLMSGNDFVTTVDRFATALGGAVGGNARRSRDSLLYDLVLLFTRRRDRDGAGRSILAPLLDPDAEPTDEFDWIFLKAHGSTDTPAAIERTLVRGDFEENELMFASIGAPLENLETARPLDDKSVARVLLQTGLATGDVRSVVKRLKSDGEVFTYDDSAVRAEVLVMGRRLRALLIVLDIDDGERSSQVAQAFEKLGYLVGARLASEDDWFDENNV